MNEWFKIDKIIRVGKWLKEPWFTRVAWSSSSSYWHQSTQSGCSKMEQWPFTRKTMSTFRSVSAASGSSCPEHHKFLSWYSVWINFELLLLRGDRAISDDSDVPRVGQVSSRVLADRLLCSRGGNRLADQPSGQRQVKRKHLLPVVTSAVRGAVRNRPSVHVQPPPASKTLLKMNLIQ